MGWSVFLTRWIWVNLQTYHSNTQVSEWMISNLSVRMNKIYESWRMQNFINERRLYPTFLMDHCPIRFDNEKSTRGRLMRYVLEWLRPTSCAFPYNICYWSLMCRSCERKEIILSRVLVFFIRLFHSIEVVKVWNF